MSKASPACSVWARNVSESSMRSSSTDGSMLGDPCDKGTFQERPSNQICRQFMSVRRMPASGRRWTFRYGLWRGVVGVDQKYAGSKNSGSASSGGEPSRSRKHWPWQNQTCDFRGPSAVVTQTSHGSVSVFSIDCPQKQHGPQTIAISAENLRKLALTLPTESRDQGNDRSIVNDRGNPVDCPFMASCSQTRSAVAPQGTVEIAESGRSCPRLTPRSPRYGACDCS